MSASRTYLAFAVLLAVTPARVVRAQRTVDALNTAIADATRRMDNAASLAFWADDGISILPSAKVTRGKPAIAEYFAAVMKSIAGATMQSFDMRCFDLRTTGDLASEWCIEHQVVQLADKSIFDGWGKMAFVLRRNADGNWRLLQETWVQSEPEPETLSGKP